MSVKSFAAALFMCAVSVSGIRAANVSFLVMETGLPRESATSQYSVMWENGLLEVFFESGHIVSNAPRMRLAGDVSREGFPPEAERDRQDAANGGMDYFLIAIVDHPSHNVSLRLFGAASGEMIAQRTHAGSQAWNTREEHESIRSAIRAMAAFLR